MCADSFARQPAMLDGSSRPPLRARPSPGAARASRSRAPVAAPQLADDRQVTLRVAEADRARDVERPRMRAVVRGRRRSGPSRNSSISRLTFTGYARLRTMAGAGQHCELRRRSPRRTPRRRTTGMIASVVAVDDEHRAAHSRCRARAAPRGPGCAGRAGSRSASPRRSSSAQSDAVVDLLGRVRLAECTFAKKNSRKPR